MEVDPVVSCTVIEGERTGEDRRGAVRRDGIVHEHRPRPGRIPAEAARNDRIRRPRSRRARGADGRGGESAQLQLRPANPKGDVDGDAAAVRQQQLGTY